MHGALGHTKQPFDAHCRGRMIRVPVEGRLAQLRSQLLTLGVGLPESPKAPGAPNIDEVGQLISAHPDSFGFVNGVPRPARTLLWALADEIGLTKLSVFRDATAGQQLGVSSHQVDETMETLLDWMDQVRQRGLRVPERPFSPGKANLAAIAIAASVDPKRLSSRNQPYHFLIAQLADELGFMSTAAFGDAVGIDLRSSRSRAEEENRALLLKVYLSRHHIKAAIALPESGRAYGRPSYRTICQNAGLHWKGEVHGSKLICIIDDAAQIVGIGADCFRPQPKKVGWTFGDILDAGTRRFELEAASPTGKGSPRFRWAFRTWLTAIGKAESDQAGENLCQLISETFSRHAVSIANPDTRRHWIGAMERWSRYIADLTGRQQGLRQLTHQIAAQ